jgi:hypothetical protein
MSQVVSKRIQGVKGGALLPFCTFALDQVSDKIRRYDPYPNQSKIQDVACGAPVNVFYHGNILLRRDQACHATGGKAVPPS